MKTLKRLLAPLVLEAVALAAPAAALAQNSGNLVPSTIRPINNAVSVVRGIIQFILVVAFVAAFIFLIIGGLRWITAGGDEKAVSSARNMITAALVGLVIVLVAYAIIRLVEIFFQVNIISQGVNIPTINTAN